MAGLLHDLDYERYPEEYCKKATIIMEERDVDPVYIVRAARCSAKETLKMRDKIKDNPLFLGFLCAV